jgi:DNA-binding HxlR family transcriptional regulator
MWCSVAQCLDTIGDSWTMLIVREAFVGLTRFDELQTRLGIPRNTLKDRLNKLVEAGVLEKVPYSDRPLRHEYRLTETGRDLWPVLSAMRQWGDQHGLDNRPPVRLAHRSCGAHAEVAVRCSGCGELLAPDDVVLHDFATGENVIPPS